AAGKPADDFAILAEFAVVLPRRVELSFARLFLPDTKEFQPFLVWHRAARVGVLKRRVDGTAEVGIELSCLLVARSGLCGVIVFQTLAVLVPAVCIIGIELRDPFQV